MRKLGLGFVLVTLLFLTSTSFAKGKDYESATVLRAKHEMVDAGYVGASYSSGIAYARPVQYAVFTGLVKTSAEYLQVQYVADSPRQYIPQWDKGDRLSVRVQGKKLYVKRDDGKPGEVKLRILGQGASIAEATKGGGSSLDQRLEKYQKR